MPALLRDRIAQLVLVRFGSNISPTVAAVDDFPRLADLIRQHKIGGVALFNGGTSVQTHDLLSQLQAISNDTLLVTADMERGLAQQTTDLKAWPHALAFDRLGTDAVAAVEEFARLSASEARSVGVHVSFSPVADIHRHPENPIIANRAFGTSPARTAELAAAYIRGCHAGDLMCCVKHFPGHGSTTEDSHDVLPLVTEPLEQLSQTDFAPFRAAIEAGTDLVMTAHVAYPGLDPTGCPATLSPVILTEMLRNEWGYQGAIITDSLQMAGVRQQAATEGKVAVAAVQAGADLLLDVGDVVGVIDAVEQAAAANPDLMARIDDAYQRVQRLKQRASTWSVWSADDAPNRPREQALCVARQSLTIVQSDGRLELPINPKQRIGLLLINLGGDNGYTDTTHILELFRARPRTEVCVFRSDTQSAQGQTDIQKLAACDVCVVACVATLANWQSSVVSEWPAQMAQRLIAERPTIVAALGIPELLDRFSAASMLVATFSDVPVCQRALYERIAVAAE